MIWSKLKIRSKILIMLLPALLPMIIIIGATYQSVYTISVKNSKQLTQLIVENGASNLYIGASNSFSIN